MAGLEEWRERIAALDPGLAKSARTLTEDKRLCGLLESVFGNSPFLSQCILGDIGFFEHILRQGPDRALGDVLATLPKGSAAPGDPARLMSELREARRRVALLVGLADITGAWNLDRVTAVLSDFAAAAISSAASHLLRQAHERGELALPFPDDPELDCGLIVLAMGKLGARELNYSSDIDLIVLFDEERVRYRGRRNPQDCFIRLTRDLVRILDERTDQGRVFRTDLRLRPDPSAMPIALTVTAAETYYESLGQNWERAAMIKARPVAGDIESGLQFIANLRPFIWRKHLDFMAIQDIHSIKRQINAHRGGGNIAVLGHNIKLGSGGIREIEFFAQTQQLIWGGREPRLRQPRTVDALRELAAAGHIDRQAADDLSEAYEFLRRLEHRLQMVHDRQTHSLPSDEQGFAQIAAFMGYTSSEALRDALLHQLRTVADYYANLFEEAPSLSGPGNLVFTGGEPEPDTVATLESMGFVDGGRVFNVVSGWHRGRYAATRNKRAREILTELMPTLLEYLSKTANPDIALARFDEFLCGLPAGAQVFSLLAANPRLLELLADVMGGAPALAQHLSRNPQLLDAVLTPGFFERLPDRASLEEEFREALAQARDFEDILDISRRCANDRKFQVGIHILHDTSDIDEMGRALSDLADTVIRYLYEPVIDELSRRHGRLPGAGMAVLGMGKLGSREMTVSSDLDLIFIYDAPEGVEASDGPKPLAPSHYFARLAQRLINALSALTAEGRLYDIDMRLRPSGKSGPIGTSLEAFRRYQVGEAWTWEHMALTRARVVSGETAFSQLVERTTRGILCAPRDPARLLADVAGMRERIEREHPADSLWDVKYLRGGLVDIEFLAQYLQLLHAHQHPQVLGGTQHALAALAQAGLIGTSLAVRLIDTARLMRQIQGFLRLTIGPRFDEGTAPEGLKASLCRATGVENFAALKDRLITSAQIAHEAFRELVDQPAHDQRDKLGHRG